MRIVFSPSLFTLISHVDQYQGQLICKYRGADFDRRAGNTILRVCAVSANLRNVISSPLCSGLIELENL